MTEVLRPRADEKVRVFFALWPDATIRRQFAQWADLLQSRCGGRLTPTHNLHLTLVFIGSVPAARVGQLASLAEPVDFSGFTLEFAQPVFWKRNRVVCAVPNATPDPLASLVARIESALQQADFGFDRRSYLPHVTLVRDAGFAPLEFSCPAVRWQVGEFALLRSRPDQGHVRYEPVGMWPK